MTTTEEYDRVNREITRAAHDHLMSLHVGDWVGYDHGGYVQVGTVVAVVSSNGGGPGATKVVCDTGRPDFAHQLFEIHAAAIERRVSSVVVLRPTAITEERAIEIAYEVNADQRRGIDLVYAYDGSRPATRPAVGGVWFHKDITGEDHWLTADDVVGVFRAAGWA